MRKIFLIATLLDCYIVTLFSVPPVFASEEFETAYQVRYEVQPDGQATVSQDISLTNKLARVYASRYSLTVPTGRIANIEARDAEGPLKIETTETSESTVIDFPFNQQVVGQGKVLTFQVKYDALDLVQKNGQVWEVSYPKLSQESEIDHYSLTLAAPLNFGQPAFITPQPTSQGQEGNFNLFYFNREQLLATGINAGFGQFQIFDFVLNYHLENPGMTLGETEIALPPDTAFQRVFYAQIDPPPLKISLDADGNWLAKYRLQPQGKLNITAVGKAKTFAQPQENFPRPAQTTLNKNLLPQEYWEVDNPLIQSEAERRRTPQAIYRFVVETLNYDFSRMGEGAARLGAVGALKNPNQAICTEFTDLFITLARAAGIPAREVNGYAYTTNAKLKPLSLAVDVLHAWPEYWDEAKQAWIPVDPTWEKTAGGIDYFTKIDLHRFAFALHGQSSERPYPAGSYKGEGAFGKDVQVVFGQYETEEEPRYEIAFDLPQRVFYYFGGKGKIIIRNTGQGALYNLKLRLETSNLILASPSDKIIPFLAPYSTEEIPVKFQPQNWLSSGRGKIIAQIDQQENHEEVKIGSFLGQLVFPPTLSFSLAGVAFFMLKIKRRNEN